MSKLIKNNRFVNTLYRPKAIYVISGSDNAPVAVGSASVHSLREQWLVEDLWWTEKPLRRHYFEVLLSNGCNTVVFLDLTNGQWFEQRGA